MGLRLDIVLEQSLLRWLINPKRQVPIPIQVIVLRRYRDIVAATRRLECPFCHRKFRRTGTLVRHLKRSDCRAMFYAWMHDIIDLYHRLRTMVRHNGAWFVYTPDGTFKFSNPFDAYAFALRYL